MSKNVQIEFQRLNILKFITKKLNKASIHPHMYSVISYLTFNRHPTFYFRKNTQIFSNAYNL